jgi:hypothetical protein
MKIKQKTLSVAVATAALNIYSPNVANAAPFVTISPAIDNGARIMRADTHPYRHCHNIATRVYCHTAEKLPRNWPPHSNTRGAHKPNSRAHSFNSELEIFPPRPDGYRSHVR